MVGAGGPGQPVSEFIKLAKECCVGTSVCTARTLELLTVPAEEGREKAAIVVYGGLQGEMVIAPGARRWRRR